MNALVTSDPTTRSERDAREQMREELGRARLSEALHHEAALAVRDVATLRLFALKQEIAPLLEATPEAREFIDLALVPGDPPRLWLDLVSYVTMAPDPRTWRLVQDTADGHDILFETTRLEDMTAFVRKFIAHRVVQRQRLLAGARPGGTKSGNGYAALWLAWLAGLASGALALLAWLVHAGRLG